jgi:invasion protein IalB
MVFARLVKAATFGVAAGMALTLGVTAGMAQGKDKPAAPAAGSELDVWYKLCVDVPTPDQPKEGEQPKPQKIEDMKKTNVCMTQWDVREPTTRIPIGKLGVRQIAGQPKPQLTAVLPLTSLLPFGVLVKIDENQPIKLTYTTCNHDGCYAEAPIEPANVDQMKTGKQIAYLGVSVQGQTLTVPLPLEGFGKAYDGAPVPINKHNEEQQKIAEMIKQKVAELRAQQQQQQGQPAAPAAAPAAPAPKKK